MNLIRLNPPVAFGADEFEPVEFVCCLSAVDRKMPLRDIAEAFALYHEPGTVKGKILIDSMGGN